MTNSQQAWLWRVLTFLAWGLAALSVTFWALRLMEPAPGKLTLASEKTAANAPDPALLMRALGAATAAAEPQVAAASRYSLVGVIADRSHDGAALIAIQGMPARPFRVGSQVDAGLVLQSVGRRSASLGGSASTPSVIVLEMPALPPADRD